MRGASRPSIGSRSDSSFNGRRMKWLIGGLAAAALLVAALLGGPIAHAQSGYPSRTDPTIDDYAHLLSADDAAAVRGLLTDLKSAHGIEAVVVTINSIHDYATGDTTIEDFALHLFNTWGIGDSTRNDGVLVLVAVKDRAVRIQLGTSYGSGHSADMQAVIDRYMLPDFKQGAYSRGIRSGVEAAIGKLTGEPIPESGGALSAAPPAATTTPDPGLVFVLGVLGLAGVGGGAAAIKHFRPRRCAKCQRPMKRLDAAGATALLDKAQQTEQRIRSAKYEVWQCPACGANEIVRHEETVAGYSPCPKCEHNTLESKTLTLKPATTKHPGKEQLTRTCVYCDYADESTYDVPELADLSINDNVGYSGGSRSSNRRFWDRDDRDRGGRFSGGGSSGGSSNRSSGGSSGGGSSSGGGASGKW